MDYLSEQDFVDEVIDILALDESPWGFVRVAREFFYSSGRTDLLFSLVNGDIVAFEFKLSRWRDALHQAYRSTAFAHRAYVVLPASAANLAKRHNCEFERRGVGLCSYSGKTLEVIVEAPRLDPIQPWLTKRASEKIQMESSCRSQSLSQSLNQSAEIAG